MNFLMECMKENKEYDYWVFSALSGDCFVQVFNVNKQKWSTCFSQSKFDYQLIKRVFDPIGYDFIYIEPEEWKKNKASIKEKMIQYIDKGVPIIAKGFQSIVKGIKLPTNEVSCIVGYDTDRQHFYRMTEETTDLITFSLDDPLPYIFVFPGKKIKESESIASIYRSALINAPKLMHTPPCDDNDAFFGNDAFEKWAKSLENDFYHIKRSEFEYCDSIASWLYYCVYMCILSTNIFSKKKIIDKEIDLNPDLSDLAPLIEKEYEILGQLERDLQNAQAEFDITYETLQDTAKTKEIAQIITKFPIVMNRICEIFEKISNK